MLAAVFAIPDVFLFVAGDFPGKLNIYILGLEVLTQAISAFIAVLFIFFRHVFCHTLLLWDWNFNHSVRIFVVNMSGTNKKNFYKLKFFKLFLSFSHALSSYTIYKGFGSILPVNGQKHEVVKESKN
ncbi:MAG: hypothetical protein GX197_04895 [Firmicutes bacterium]|nr:hypothetical protein [Bacillota bacterium]